MMKSIWKSLTSMADHEVIPRGSIIKCNAEYPFEKEIVLLICENRLDAEMPLNLVVLTGHKAAINPLQNLPIECLNSNGALTVGWLKNNWGTWVQINGNIKSVYIRGQRLQASDFNSE